MSVTVRLTDPCPWPGGYSSTDVRVPWQPGEAREVPEALAAYLTSTFPGVFVPPDAPLPAPVEPEKVPDPDPALHPKPGPKHFVKPPKPPKGR